MKKITKIIIELVVFIFFVTIFTILYKVYDSDLTVGDALYISVGFQTFNGTSNADHNEKLREVATIQMLSSYVLIIVIMYNLIKE